MSGRIVRRQPQRCAVEGSRCDRAALPAPGCRGLLGIAAHQPELDVVEVCCERLVQRLLVSRVQIRVAEIGDRFELLKAQRHASLLSRGRVLRQGLRPLGSAHSRSMIVEP